MQSQARPDLDPRHQPAGERAVAERMEAIRQELASPGFASSWAGEYVSGDTQLAVAPRSGFAFQLSGCLGIYDRNLGSVTENGGRLDLDPLWPNEPDQVRRLPASLVPVSWGPRRYLIAPDQFASFAHSCDRGWEPREYQQDGLFFLRKGDETISVTGMPDVPAEYATLFRARATRATILTVDASRIGRSETDEQRITDVTLDIGYEQGAFEGMMLAHPGSPDSDFWYVADARATTSTAVCLSRGAEGTLPEVGWELVVRR